MPNHVTTRCWVEGPAAELCRFRDRCLAADPKGDGRCFDFNNIMPRPPILDATTSGGFVVEGMLALGITPPPTSRAMHYRTEKAAIGDFETLRRRLAKNNPQALDQAMKSIHAMQETGYIDWYDWCLDHWGTKWNSYDFHLERDDVQVIFGDALPKTEKAILRNVREYLAATGKGQEALVEMDVMLQDGVDAALAMDEAMSTKMAPLVIEFVFDTAWSFPEPIFEKISHLFPGLKFEAVAFDPGWSFAVEATYHEVEGISQCDYEEGDNDDRMREIYEQVHNEPYVDEEDE